MNQSDLVQKLHAMRSAAGKREVDVMTRLFGVIFDRDITACGTNPGQIVNEYLRVYDHKVGKSGHRGWTQAFTVRDRQSGRIAEVARLNPKVDDTRGKHA